MGARSGRHLILMAVRIADDVRVGASGDLGDDTG